MSFLDFKDKWWNTEREDEVCDLVFSTVDSIYQNQQYRELANLRNAALYSNVDFMGLYGARYGSLSTPILSNRVTLNVIKACVDTAASKIAKAKPRIMFLTEKGNYSQKRKSKQMTQYLEGVFADMNLYDLGATSFLHAGVMGTGFIKFYPDYHENKIKAEHILTDEIIVDDNEGIYGSTRTMYQKKFVDKDLLAAKFPEHKHKIMELDSSNLYDNGALPSNHVLVIESWRLPSQKGAKDGRHAICVENTNLLVEKYTKDYFPFIVYRWNKNLVGYWGRGIAEELTGIQIEINKILRNIQIAQKLCSRPRIFVDSMSDFDPEILSNESGAWYKYSGVKPSVEVFQAMTAEVYTYLWDLYNKAFEIVGIGQLSASGKKPAGLDAAVALREYQDIETERFSLNALAYQNMFVDAAKIILDMSKDLYGDQPDLELSVNAGKFVKKIKWNDIYMKDDDYILRAFPVSILPSEPAGKLQFVQELIQGGYIDKEFGQSLLDFPDLEGYMSIANASVDSIQMAMEAILDEDRYVVPTPYMDFRTGQVVAQKELLRGDADGLPEYNKDLLRRFIEDCQVLIDKEEGSLQAAQPGTEGTAPEEMEASPQLEAPVLPQTEALLPGQAVGVPEASPESELLPLPQNPI